MRKLYVVPMNVNEKWVCEVIDLAVAMPMALDIDSVKFLGNQSAWEARKLYRYWWVVPVGKPSDGTIWKSTLMQRLNENYKPSEKLKQPEMRIGRYIYINRK